MAYPPKPYPKKKAARAAVETQQGFIYVAELLNEPVVKIGFSLNPQERLKYLFTRRSPGRLVAMMLGTIKQERELHRQLAEHRMFACNTFTEGYPRSILTHEAIPEGLRGAA